jgi:uncharacterized protein (TIGR02466 family)
MTTQVLKLLLPSARAMTATAEIALLEAGLALRADDRDRLKLAQLYLRLARPEDAERMVGTAPTDPGLSFPFAVTLGEVQLALASPAAAAATLERAVAQAGTPYEASRALGGLGKALMQLRRLPEARAVLERAIALDHQNTFAITRLARVELDTCRALALLERTRGWIASGKGNSGVLVAQVLALSALGLRDDALAMTGVDKFLHAEMLPVPPGWSDLEAFNRALTEEVFRHPDRKRPIGTRGIVGRQRVDGLMHVDMPVFTELARAIAGRAAAFAAKVGPVEHDWNEARPRQAELQFWSMITRNDGFDDWHMHHRGWLSGVYYARMPEPVSAGAGLAGCIEFGVPQPAGGAGAVVIRPRPGMLLLFPSHLHHRTHPSDDDAHRVSIAFDAVPRATAGH